MTGLDVIEPKGRIANCESMSISIMEYLAVKHFGAIIALSATVTLAVGIASATPKQVSKNGDWTLYMDEDGGKTCFISSRPKSQVPKNRNWNAVFHVTRGATTEGRYEPSVAVDYTYQDGSQATVSIGSDTFTLFTDKDSAWVHPDQVAEERKLIDAMKDGTTMIVKGTSSRGTLTTDTFSLSGVTAGLKALSTTCP